MTAKEYLRQARDLKRDIERKQNQIQVLRAMAERTTSAHEALRTSGTPNHSKMEDAVIKLVEIGESLTKDIAAYTQKYREIAAVIDAVENPTYRQLLGLKYLNFKEFDEVAEIMHYSYRQITRLHGEALLQIVI